MILIDSTYINNSGGKILLEYLIQAIFRENMQDRFFFIFDNRLKSECAERVEEKRKITIIGGEKERRKIYLSHVDHFDAIFCFANVPPPIKVLKDRVYIYFHNALLLENKISNYNVLQRFVFNLKRFYIKHKNQKNYTWIVQTKHIKIALETIILKNQDILVLPIYNITPFLNVNQQLPQNNNNYLYIADGVKQKNHNLLLKAWEILFDERRLTFALNLTVPKTYPLLLHEIDRLIQKGVNIVNHGLCTKEQIIELYSRCNHFIIPSLSESFGLPIIEAASAGCKLIAADLDYVYDIIEPSASFNPKDPDDLIRAILYSRKEKRLTKVIIKNEIKTLMNLLTSNV